MAKIIINKIRCKGCGLCVLYCPNKLICIGNSINIKGAHPAKFTDNGKCTGCLHCALVCPDCAIEVYK